MPSADHLRRMARSAPCVWLLALGPCSKHPPPVVDSGSAASATDGAAPEAIAAVVSVKATTVTTLPAIGPRAPHAATTAFATMAAQRCAAGTPVTVGSSDATTVPAFAAAFGASDGLVAWTSHGGKSNAKMSTAPLARDGTLAGPVHELDVPAELNRVFGVIRLADAYVAFLARTNFDTTPLSQDIYALPLKPDGTALGKAALLDIGHHNAIAASSPNPAAAAHGFAIFEGSSTTGAKARLLVAGVGADGVVTQFAKDLDGIEPGSNVRYSFGPKHMTALAGGRLVVDGGDATPTTVERDAPDGAVFATTNDETGISMVAPINDRKTLATKSFRYGKLGLDGATKLEAKPRPVREPLRAPFGEEEARFVVTAEPGAVTLAASSSVRGVPLVKSFAFDAPGLTSGIWTTGLWSGDRFLVVYSAGHDLEVAPLQCESEAGAVKPAR